MSDSKERVVIALGYFDSLHIGHQEVIKKAKSLALELNAKLLVFTFSENVKAILYKTDEKNIYTKSEREKIMKSLGADDIYFAPVDNAFLSLSKKEFLDFLSEKYDVLGYAFGSDYTFGERAEGDAEYLKEYAISHNKRWIAVGILTDNGEKISTTKIRELLNQGKVEKASKYLGRDFSVSGVVKENRKVGRSLGFPTANLDMDCKKQGVLEGVYAGYALVENKKYKAVINCGNRPTFDINKKQIEAHLLDYNGDLYGKEIEVFFTRFLRHIVKFNSEKELTAQIKSDIEKTRGIND